jgi:hypothetical protein
MEICSIPTFFAVTMGVHWTITALEILSLVSTPIVAVLAGLALRQIWLTKKLAEISHERETHRLAVEKVIEYADEICPLFDTFREAYYEHSKFPILKSCENKYEIHLLKNGKGFNFNLKGIDNLQHLLNEGGIKDRLILRFCNKLEGFSMWFVSGQADLNVAENPIRHSFLTSMNIVMPFVIANHQVSNKTQYSNMLKLYNVWITQDLVKKSQKDIEEAQKATELAEEIKLKTHGSEFFRKKPSIMLKFKHWLKNKL